MPMQYVPLGKSGLKVSKLILGMSMFGDPRFMPFVLGEKEGYQLVQAAYEHGIQTFDTADAYSSGLSERILGNAIKKLNLPRGELVLMTKLGLPMFPLEDPDAQKKRNTPEKFGIINQHGTSRKHIFDAVKGSLEWLQVDYIDVLHCHRFDANTPIEETMHALHDVVKAGWVRYLAMSSCWAYQFHAMQNYALANGLTPFISMQNHYNLLYREEEREMLPTLRLFGAGSTPWSPLAKGLLARPFDAEAGSLRSQTDPGLLMYKSDATPVIVSRLEEIAKRRGASMAQVSLAWLMSREGVTAPIIGPNSVAKLEDLLGSLDVILTEEEVRYLEEPYAPMGIAGHI
ncbi:Aldo/keto reductase [Trametes versicolor FP-101664 SS1]|uniref:Aldo/keto reductase n=1 Tax=Trametes versicolor (strain FP-101664) TaxID=717944 RepID=UPI00046243CC|nr:Aldo/keto reductase [Trametes versicolor FP-101664 SS1]EIW61071.1 Aldo/keto reductase [Trametes versicolor FP-101664 SS1]